MKPLGIQAVKFPGKTDCHPKPGYRNWWEIEWESNPTTKRARQRVAREIAQEASDYYSEETPMPA